MIKNRFIIFFVFFNLFQFIYTQSINDDYCKGSLVYKDLSNQKQDELDGFNFVKYNGSYIPCVIPCPSPFFTLNHWQQLLDMSLVMGTISTLCSLFLIVTYSPLINKKQSRHSIGVMCMSIGCFCAMITDMMNFGKSVKSDTNSICIAPGQYPTQSNSYCVATGIILQFGGVLGFEWWCLLSFDLLMNIKQILTKDYNKYYVSITLSIALVSCLVPLADKQYGMSYIGLGCWLGTFQIYFFWIPLSICLIVASVFLFIILKDVYSILKLSKKLNSIHVLKRQLLSTIFMAFTFFFMFFYYISIAAKRSDLEVVLQDYVDCSMDPLNSDPSSCSAAKISFGAEFIFLLCLRLMGIFAFTFYGLSRDVKNIWLNSIFFKNKYYSIGNSSSSSTKTTLNVSNYEEAIDDKETVSSDKEQNEIELDIKNSEQIIDRNM